MKLPNHSPFSQYNFCARGLEFWENQHMMKKSLEVQKNLHMGYRAGKRPATPALGPLNIGSIGKFWVCWKNLVIAAKISETGKKWKSRPARAQSGGAIMNKSIIICKQIVNANVNKKWGINPHFC